MTARLERNQRAGSSGCGRKRSYEGVNQEGKESKRKKQAREREGHRGRVEQAKELAEEQRDPRKNKGKSKGKRRSKAKNSVSGFFIGVCSAVDLFIAPKLKLQIQRR